MNTVIISAFPACGKTFIFENWKDKIILDSDSSRFSWIYEEYVNSEGMLDIRKTDKRNPDFPNNYIIHIKENIGKVNYIFVSSHEEVRNILDKSEIGYILVYPEKRLKEEWVGRCFLRGSGEKFCNLIANNWDNWISQCESIKNHACYELKHGEHLSDAIVKLGHYTC